MSDEKQNSNSGGIGVFGALGVLFVGLKLTGYIDWEWAWVLAPFWMPVAAALIFIVIALAIFTIKELME